MKRIFLAVFAAAISMTIAAQSGTNSPYSQYGWGLLADQTSGFNRGMNGVGLGFREHNQVNYINPASYSSMDSLMFLFDIGASGQIANFKENGTSLNAKNADFEYAVAGFRAFKKVGVSFGIIPYTNVGYNYSNTEKVSGMATTTYTNSYSGSGGLHQVYLGAGWEFVKGLSVGANVSYLWGGFDRYVVNSYSDVYANTLSKYYSTDVRTYKIDFGLQYTAKLNKKDHVTLGLTYSLGHKFDASPECKVISTNSQTYVSDTASYSLNENLEFPHMFGAGLMWNHNNKWKIGVDYTLQKWADISFPEYGVINEKAQYKLTDNYFSNRQKVNLGGEYCQNENSRKFFNRIRYRAGISYANSYYKVNGQDGPKELSVSAGFGIPIVNGYNNRSILNISAQWIRNAASGLMTDNTFRINIGITFNERWFQKWKFD